MRFTRPGARKILGAEPNLAEKVAERDLTMSAWCEFAWRLAIAESTSSPRQKLIERYAARTRPNAEANESSGQGTNGSEQSRKYAIVYTSLTPAPGQHFTGRPILLQSQYFVKDSRSSRQIFRVEPRSTRWVGME